MASDKDIEKRLASAEEQLASANLAITLLTSALNGKFERHVVMRAMDGTYNGRPRKRGRKGKGDVFVAEPGSSDRLGVMIVDFNAEEFELSVRGHSLDPSIYRSDVTVRLNKLELLEALIEVLKVGE